MCSLIVSRTAVSSLEIPRRHQGHMTSLATITEKWSCFILVLFRKFLLSLRRFYINNDGRILDYLYMEAAFISVSSENVSSFAQGDFKLVERDIAWCLGKCARRHRASASRLASRAWESLGIRAAFAVRRELVSLKKVLQRLASEAASLEREASRHATFLYRNIDEPQKGERWELSEEYVCASAALQGARGLSRALTEARGLVKSLCCLPRFPPLKEAEEVRGLFPRSGAKTVEQGVEFLQSLGFEVGGEQQQQQQQQDAAEAKAAGAEEGGFRVSPNPLSLEAVAAAVKEGKGKGEEEVRVELGIEREGVSLSLSLAEALWRSFVARGAYKACEMRRRAQILCRDLDRISARAKRAESVLAAQLQLAKAPAATTDQLELTAASNAAASVATSEAADAKLDLLRTHGDGHCRRLAAAAAVSSELCKWLRASLQSDGRQRLFVAGDGEGGAGVIFPTGFGDGIPRLLAAAAERLEPGRKLLRRGLEEEGWPPPTSRPSVLGAYECYSCGGMFGRAWLEIHASSSSGRGCGGCGGDRSRVKGTAATAAAAASTADVTIRSAVRGRGLCCVCVESFVKRERRCPMAMIENKSNRSGGGKGGKSSPCSILFCPHLDACAVHGKRGGGLRCIHCRLARGDGSDVGILCASLLRAEAQGKEGCEEKEKEKEKEVEVAERGEGEKRVALFLDFDRTLATTVGGGDPLSGKHQHRVDDALRACVASCRSLGAEAFVVTRNSHGASIATFLSLHDCRVDGIVCVASKKKARRGGGEEVGRRGGGKEGEEDKNEKEEEKEKDTVPVFHCKSGDKTTFITETLDRLERESGGEVRGVFVDDDARELAAAAGEQRLWRVMFARTNT